MNEIVKVTCAETHRPEYIELDRDGNIPWCSRATGRPDCSLGCKAHLNPKPQAGIQSKPPATT